MTDPALRLFHILWTKAVGTKDYDKQQWLKFEGLLTRQLQRQSERRKLDRRVSR